MLNFNLFSSLNSFLERNIFSLLLCNFSSNNLPFLLDLLVILNCLIHNLWEEMISYELQMHPWNYLFSTGCSGRCICHQDHVARFCSEIGGRIIRGSLAHTHMFPCQYADTDDHVHFLGLSKSKHPTFIAALSIKKKVQEPSNHICRVYLGRQLFIQFPYTRYKIQRRNGMGV